MIVLGKRYDLSSIDTIKYLIKCGANDNSTMLCWGAGKGYLDVVKYIVESDVNIHAKKSALRFSAKNGHLSVVSPNPGLATRVRA